MSKTVERYGLDCGTYNLVCCRLKGEELEGSLLRLRANLHHYEGSIWMGFVDKVSQGEKADDAKLLVQKSDLIPEKMDWNPIEKSTKW